MINNETKEKLKEEILKLERETLMSVNKVLDVQIIERIKNLYEEMNKNAN